MIWWVFAGAMAAQVVQRDGEPVRLRGPLDDTPLDVQGRARRLVVTDRLTVEEAGRTLLDVPADNAFLVALLADHSLPLDSAGITLVRAYGAMFVGEGLAPPTERFADQQAIDRFESGLVMGTATFSERVFRLQKPAAEALTAAVTELKAQSVPFSFHRESVTSRTWATSDRYWRSRTKKALAKHVEAGRVDAAESARIQALGMPAHMNTVLELEARGLFFHPDLDRTLLRWVAPPGTSQHHSLLAVDFTDPVEGVVDVMERHGFFRTVLDDDDHFTWLGLTAAQVRERGLKQAEGQGGRFWIVDL